MEIVVIVVLLAGLVWWGIDLYRVTNRLQDYVRQNFIVRVMVSNHVGRGISEEFSNELLRELRKFL